MVFAPRTLVRCIAELQSNPHAKCDKALSWGLLVRDPRIKAFVWFTAREGALSMEELSIAISREAGATVRTHVRGQASLEATIAYWRAILDEVDREPARRLMLVDELRGPALTADDWQSLVAILVGSSLADVRIAHVKPHGLDQVEHCELSATQAGFEARVFSDERLAGLWLHYGGSREG